MSLGERIKTCRQHAGLSQEKVAELVGVSRQAVTKWETDKSAPSTENLFKLAEIFGTTVDMMLVEKEQNDQSDKKSTLKLRVRNVLFVILGYFLFYLVGRIMWVPIHDVTLLGWFTTKSPYAIHNYLYGWLFSSNLIWYSMIASALFSAFGKFKVSWISYVGFVAGYVLGHLFGPYPEGASLGHGHYGWAIWGVTFLVSILVGCVVEHLHKND